MKAVVYEGAKDVRCEEKSLPEKAPGTVLIRVMYSGICGSDLTTWYGVHPRAKAPLIMGHEFSGIVAEDTEKWKKGTRVSVNPLISCGSCLPCRSGNAHVCAALKVTGIDCDGAMAEYIRVPEDKPVPLPDGLSFKLGALIEPVAVTVHAVRNVGYRPGDNAVIFGAGTIGMLTALTLRKFGAVDIVIVEPDPKRREMASGMGFLCIDPAVEDVLAFSAAHTGGDGFDWVFDCAGVQPTADIIFRVGKIRGTVAVIASYKKDPVLPMATALSRELTVRFNRVYRPEDFEIASRIISSVPEYERVITHVLPMEECAKAFVLCTTPGSGAVKVMFRTGETEEE